MEELWRWVGKPEVRLVSGLDGVEPRDSFCPSGSSEWRQHVALSFEWSGPAKSSADWECDDAPECTELVWLKCFAPLYRAELDDVEPRLSFCTSGSSACGLRVALSGLSRTAKSESSANKLVTVECTELVRQS